jgi:hypothetical protein
MAQPTPTSINCPSCGQPFRAIIEQTLDVGRDPTAKERLLAGRVNLVACPHCGYQGVLSTTLVYHDPAKELLVTYAPMDLGMVQSDQERAIGDLVNRVISDLPGDQRKAYLLQPQTVLTLQGLVDKVLEADGITPDMIEAQRRRLELVEAFAQVEADQVEGLIQDNMELFDLEFFALLAAAAEAATMEGDSRRSLRLLNVRSQLMERTEVGHELQAQEQAIAEAMEELRALGERVTRDQFVDLLIRSADDPVKVEVIALAARPLIDYTTFQMITERISQSTDEEQERLSALRDQLLNISAALERQERAVAQRATDTLRTLMQASDVSAAVQAHIDLLDEAFLRVLQINLDAARQAGDVQTSGRLREIRDAVLQVMQQSAPPEIRLINDLLMIEDEWQAVETLRQRHEEVNQDVIALMDDLAAQLRDIGNQQAAHRLDVLRAEAETLVG